MKIQQLLLLSLVSILSYGNLFSQTINLKNLEWKLENHTYNISINKANPSDVHLSLISAGIIKDPFYRDNEKDIQWVGEEDWVYSTEFVVNRSLLHSKTTTIVFDGLDTYAEVLINGTSILSSENMFHKHEVIIDGLLVPGKNKIKIFFKSPIEINKKKAAAYKFSIPEERAHTRKAAYHFGWDWGPEIVCMGIWKDARIEFKNESEISDFYIRQHYLDKDIAKLEAQLEIRSQENEDLDLIIKINGKIIIEKQVSLLSGKNPIYLPIYIDNPKFWWPIGMGDQNLYSFQANLKKGDKIVHSYTNITGLRNVQIVQQRDSIGKSFFFRVNGYDIFAKGANYIPQDNFVSRLDSADYQETIKLAIDANMNMLRVWGGGIYESDIFYELCDKYGIMVWQDFMFAGSVNPTSKEIERSIEIEAEQQIKRLRNHPSIVLWCGNNEIDEAWHNWGWEKTFQWTKTDSSLLWEGYKNIFENTLPQLVKKYTPSTFYWPSSPSYGWGNDISYAEGDVHYWGVWWGKEPFEKYEEKIGRFNSEYGFQGMPSMASMKKFSVVEDWNIDSEVMDVHQKHPFGWDNIKEYMKRDYPEPQNFEQLIYLSQLMQAEGIKIAIEAHRRAKPYCMGTLYWQLNDCWPVTSWSSVDYYGNWKALHYYVKKSYAKYLISFKKKEESLHTYFISDDTSAMDIEFEWILEDLEGNTLHNSTTKMSIDANSSNIIDTPKELLNSGFTDAILTVKSSNSKGPLHESGIIFGSTKDMQIHNEKPQIEINKSDLGFTISLESSKLLKGIQISSSIEGFFSDNFFDLRAGESIQLHFNTHVEELKESDLSFIYLRK